MADKIKITDLPNIENMSDDDILIESNSSTTYKVTLGELISYLLQHNDVLNTLVPQSEKGVPNGVALLDLNGKVNNTQLNYGTTSGTIFEGSAGTLLESKINNHVNSENPHGLGNVDNTSDLDKPVSTLQRKALDDVLMEAKKYTDSVSNSGSASLDITINGFSLDSDIVLTASDVGADISGSADTALINAKNYTNSEIASAKDAINEHAKNTENPHSVTKIQLGLSNVDNTSDISKPVSTAQQNAIDLAYANATAYTDNKIAEVIGGASSTADTLEELEKAIKDHGDIVKALDDAIGSKANQTELDSHINNNTIHITSTERSGWNVAKDHAETTHAPSSAQENIIEKISVNGENILPSSKSINITVPKKMSELENDIGLSGEYTHPTYTEQSTGLYKITVDKLGHVSNVDEVTKLDITSLGIPSSDTHYISKNVVGASTATSNTSSVLANGNVHLNSIENGTITSSHKISGSGSTTVTTDSNGNIVITSTDTNTTYSQATSSTLGLVKVGSNITNLNGEISITKDNVTSALGYTPGTGSSDSDTTYTLTKSGSTITLTGSDGSKTSVSDNNTTYGTVSTTANGLCPKLDGTTTKYLRADGTWAIPESTCDIISTTEPSNQPVNGHWLFPWGE